MYLTWVTYTLSLGCYLVCYYDNYKQDLRYTVAHTKLQLDPHHSGLILQLKQFPNNFSLETSVYENDLTSTQRVKN